MPRPRTIKSSRAALPTRSAPAVLEDFEQLTRNLRAESLPRLRTEVAFASSYLEARLRRTALAERLALTRCWSGGNSN
jgi:hypothetical protein